MPRAAGSKKLTLSIAPDMHDRLAEMATERGITATEFIRRSITMMDFLDQYKRQENGVVSLKGQTNSTPLPTLL